MTNDATTVVSLYWWRLEGSAYGNFGDELTPLLLKKWRPTWRITWTEPYACQMLGIGSILQNIPASYHPSPTYRPWVWSSGFIEAETAATISANDYRIVALRGRLSMARVTDILLPQERIVLGDGGLLASDLLVNDTPPQKKRYKLGIVAHYADSKCELVQWLRILQSTAPHKGDMLFIDPTWPCKQVIRAIASCCAILSSSLHGLVVADSFAIPNAHMDTGTAAVVGGTYKFRDYYSAFVDSRRYSRGPIPKATLLHCCNDVADVLRLIHLWYTPVEPTELNAMKTRLRNALLSIEI